MIGSSHRRRAKSPLGTVLIINLLGKGLTPRAFWEMEAPFDGLLVSIIHVVFVIDYFIRDQFTFLASVQPSFDGKQYVCKTCHLIQTFSISTSVPLSTEFESITNIQ